MLWNVVQATNELEASIRSSNCVFGGSDIERRTVERYTLCVVHCDIEAAAFWYFACDTTHIESGKIKS